MSNPRHIELIQAYLAEVAEQFNSGHAIEHAYRPALQRLINGLGDVTAVNDPKHSEHGAPDFVFLKKSNAEIIKGYAEAKDINVSLDKTEKTDQMKRYAGYQNLFLTDYLEFRFFKNGEKYETISLGEFKDKKIVLTPENGQRLINELEAFLEQTPESIKSGKRLSEIMGAKARRIRDNVAIYLNDESIDAKELDKIYEMMKKLLVHDLDPAKFADMYAQTLVYGLFVARYGDSSLETFSRSEARDLVPQSNPFLLHFFDHIAGTAFDKRLAKIVDELCDIFVVSDVQNIVHKHLRIADTTDDTKDPIIHFYEDFLQAYDPAERKRMGAYYTPIPVVKFIVRHIDKLLKEEFGISKGLASDETVQHTVDTQPWRKKGERKDRLTKEVTMSRVQVLDPAVGTATFLHETINFIHEGFKGQEGRWPSYVQENLVKRLYGFELMMAPYTIAHLKLGMTLKETGVDKLKQRLNVYLTNTLEEGVPQQPDLFSFGLAEAVSEESRLAAEVKSEKPVMVVMGNPPYSGVSSNETDYANSLINKYKVEPGGQQKLQERKHWLNDDYVKFLAFAEDMIEQNGTGIVGMITNNGYLDNPTFRGMRWHLAKTFDKIYVLDLHGNAKKKEIAPGGGKDENVFDIMQGVGIILAVKTGKKKDGGLAEVYHADLWGSRQAKFDELAEEIKFEKISPEIKNVFFVPKNREGQTEYMSGVAINSLFNNGSSGVQTSRDSFVVDYDKQALSARISSFYDLSIDDKEIRNKMFKQGSLKYERGDTRGWKISEVRRKDSESNVQRYSYRPLDNRYIDYRPTLIDWPRAEVLSNMQKNNLSLTIGRQGQAVGPMTWNVVYVQDCISDLNLFYRGGGVVYPLYLNHDDGTRTPNFNSDELAALTKNLSAEYTPEDILDYIYAILHSPSYRQKYKEFLKIDFPRVPIIKSDAEFARLIPLGKRLRELHLMKASDIDNYETTFPEAGDDTVDKLRYEDGKVYINDSQYFGNVPELAWNFYIGGYQPAQKWLKDRRTRKLKSDDTTHYQRIIKILIETNNVMHEIDVTNE